MKAAIDKMSPVEIQQEVNKHRWFHSMDFGNGVITNGDATLQDVAGRISALYGGVQFNGRSILDIGAWTGAYSFEAKRRGAARVVASDEFCWIHPAVRGRAAFDLALAINGLDIEARQIDVPDINLQSVGAFDAVLFSGVFYHLLTPVHLTQQISKCATHLLMLETHQDFLDSEKPGMVMYPGATLFNDPTNWWGPNPHAVYTMLKEFGFARVFYQDAPESADPGRENFRRRGIYHAFRTEDSLRLMHDGSPSNWLDLETATGRAEAFRPVSGEHVDSKLSISDLEKENHQLRKQIAEMHASTSWRITAPVRAAKRLIS